jgi:hypothetical protein
MKRICIITSYTDHIRWDDYGKCDYGDFASFNHHEYSNKHGYSYIKEIVKNENYTDWHPTWIKIDVLKKYLPLYDYVVWIDADAVFVDQDITIENLIDDDVVDLVIPKLELDRVSGNMWTHTTTGFMIWKNSEWSNNVLNLLWGEPKQFRFEFFHEQSRLDEILYENFKFVGGENILNKNNEDIETPITLGNIKILPYSYHRYWDDGEIKYVYHAGGNTGTKLERIKKILKKDE